VGRVLDPTPLMEEAAVVRELPLLDTRTVYTRFGDVFAAACLIIALAAALWTRVGRRQRNNFSLN
jgi:apolipoprotein N-acyltransferase